MSYTYKAIFQLKEYAEAEDSSSFRTMSEMMASMFPDGVTVPDYRTGTLRITNPAHSYALQKQGEHRWKLVNGTTNSFMLRLVFPKPVIKHFDMLTTKKP